jgi:bla regulator protein blaR1
VTSLAAQALDHLWQGTLFALAVALWLRLYPAAPARLRHALCLAVALKLLIPSQAVFLLGAAVVRLVLPATRSGVPPEAVALVNPTAVWGAVSPGFAAALLVAWAVGALAVASAFRRQHRRLTAEVAHAEQVTDSRVPPLVEEGCAALGLRRHVAVTGSPGSIVAVKGALRPTLLVSAALVRRLSDEELRCLLLHELAHVRRRDTLFVHLQTLVSCLFWFHPLVWVLQHQWLQAREEACDDDVLALAGTRRGYAACLFKLVEFGLEPAGPLPAAGAGLAARVRRILRPPEERRGWSYVGASALALFLIALSALANPCLRLGP